MNLEDDCHHNLHSLPLSLGTSRLSERFLAGLAAAQSRASTRASDPLSLFATPILAQVRLQHVPLLWQ